MSKGLEALEKIGETFGIKKMSVYKDIEKELKALEIIKDLCILKVYKNKLGQCFIEGSDILFPISKEEYDLLKEVLFCC